jgi:hypothetical protein
MAVVVQKKEFVYHLNFHPIGFNIFTAKIAFLRAVKF